MVCTRTPHPARPGARRAAVQSVKARMNAIRALGRQLKNDGIEMVTLESASDYWRIWLFVLEACGLAVQLVSASQARNLPGRPKTGKLDAMWLARLTEMGLLRASFVPPKPIRDLRDYTRARTRLIHERSRCWQRLEKLLEGALVKLSSVASKLTTLPAQDMIKAMIAGQRDPEILAGLARRTMKARHDALVEALDGMFDDHHGELAALLLDQIASPDGKIAQLSARAAELAAAMPEGWGIDADGTTGPGAGTGPDAPVLNAVTRLAEIPGLSAELARTVIAETGLDMSRFPTAAHLVSRAGLCPSAHRSGPRTRAGKRAGVTPGCAGPWARLRSMRPAPPPSLVSAITGSPAAAARPKPRSPSPAPSWSSSGTCSKTRPPGSPISAPATTRPAPTSTASSAITSARFRPSAPTSA
jgi:transposase